jgi:hypothetical protein
MPPPNPECERGAPAKGAPKSQSKDRQTQLSSETASLLQAKKSRRLSALPQVETAFAAAFARALARLEGVQR